MLSQSKFTDIKSNNILFDLKVSLQISSPTTFFVISKQRRRKRGARRGGAPPNMKSGGGGAKVCFRPPIIVHIYNTSILNGWLYLK